MSTYRLTFRAPERYTIATVGALVSRETQNETTTWIYETDPVDLVTFNIGEFDEFHTEPEGAPILTVQMNEPAHQRLAARISDLGGYLPQADDMLEVVGADMTNSFRFFGDVFGPTPIQTMVATEIFSNHGEAYPGLVLLSFSTFLISDEQGEDDMFRGHEISHQWWGISVTPATYRDRWIAEGFAMFSGWWYAGASLGSIDIYQRQLREARERIVRRRDEAWPLGLGTRVGQSDDPGDYRMMIYEKGGWVLHMLKGMMTNPDTGDDSAFRRVMRRFHETYAGRKATTRDFQRIVEEEIGVEMGWFFDQWVYGSAIPTYTFSYQLSRQPDGSFGGRVRVRQEDVPDDFTMIVPILLDFGSEGTAEVRVAVRGPVSESELPALPREPDRIVFNPDEAVLAETRTERLQN
jgi:aminopeptidase N